MLDLSVIAPVFNEAENVELLCNQLHAALSQLQQTYEIILVDDGSSDGTWDLLKQQQAQIPHLRLIRLRRNFGQTAAMSAGLDHARGAIIIMLDADLQNDPKDISLLLEEMDKGYDVVSGWRRKRQDAFVHRRLPSIIANALISRITGVKLHDFGCTLKAYRAEVMKNVRLYGDLHRFIPALAHWAGGSVAEIEVSHHPRRRGKSKYGLGRISRVILDMMTISFLLRYSQSPIRIFGKWGLLTGLCGLLLLVFMALANMSHWILGTEFAASLIKRPFWVITSFMLVFFGIQFISMGLLAEIQIRTYHESQGKPIYAVRDILESR